MQCRTCRYSFACETSRLDLERPDKFFGLSTEILCCEASCGAHAFRWSKMRCPDTGACTNITQRPVAFPRHALRRSSGVFRGERLHGRVRGFQAAGKGIALAGFGIFGRRGGSPAEVWSALLPGEAEADAARPLRARGVVGSFRRLMCSRCRQWARMPGTYGLSLLATQRSGSIPLCMPAGTNPSRNVSPPSGNP